jgi:hypothetical protein
MCSIITPESEDSGKQMLNAKWIDHGGELVAVSPTPECAQMLRYPARINGMQSKRMRARHEGKVLVEQNTYECYTMDDVPPIPNFKIEFTKGKFNGMCASDWGLQLFVVSRVDATHVKSSWQGRGCHTLIWTSKLGATNARGAMR